MTILMAYNYGFPANYQMLYPQQQSQTAPAYQNPQNGNLTWVQGVEGAKAHVTAPGVPALLMDSESERFFIKTTDASGMPLPLRVFEYKEVTNNAPVNKAPDMSGYVTREEFEQYKASVGKAAKNEQSSIFDS